MLPGPSALGIDERAVERGAEAARDAAEARYLGAAIVADAESGGAETRAGIETRAFAVDIRPVRVGLNTEDSPADLPIAPDLAAEKAATDRMRALGIAERAEGGREKGISLLIERSNGRILVPQPEPPPMPI